MLFRSKIAEIAKSSWNYPAPSEKNLQEQPGFEIKKLGEELRSRGYRWIVGIDEFTRLNDILDMGDECFYQVRELLRIIKARLEDKSFSAFIVGQNSISCLLAKFPNEMAVTKSYRLLYLSKEAVFQLAEQPILQPDGSSRFNSGALNLLYDLTAGHPYFTQKFCYRLVNFLNAKKYSNVTESCIREVENIIIHDLDYLNISEFECLWQIPISQGSSIDKEDILKMLYKIASIAKDGNWCPMSDLLESSLEGEPPTASAVNDNDLGCLLEQDSFHFSSPVKTKKDLLISLCQHGTIEFFEKRVRIKVRLFADWLNANNWE